MRSGAAAVMAGLALAAAGCDERTPVNTAQNEQAPAIRMANPAHDELAALTPSNQRLGMMRAVRDTGYRCQRVDNTGYQQEFRNMRMWVAACGGEETRSFAVFIAPNRDVQVRNCEDMGRLSLPRCAPLPPAAPDEHPIFQRGAADNAFRNNF